MAMQHKVLMAVLVGIVASSAIYYGWCSWQWKEAAEANAAEVHADGAAGYGNGSNSDATQPGAGQIVSPIVKTPFTTSPTGHVFSDATGAVTVDARLGNAFVAAHGPSTVHLALTARTGEGQGAAVRVPAHVVLVIDRSGSMAGERIVHARSAAEHVLDNLQDGDSIALVTYSSGARIDHASVRLESNSRQRVRQAIRNIEVGGGTCVSCGLDQAQTQLARQHEGVQRVILLSDGQANSGITDNATLRSIAQGFDAASAPVTTIGVGLDYNEDLMTQIAVGGNGRHFFVEDPSVLAATLRDELQSLETVLARRVVARFRLGSGVRFARGFDRDFQVDGDIVTVSLGDMPANVERTALVALEVTPSAGADTPLIASVEVSYEDLRTRSPRQVSGQLSAQLSQDPSAISRGVDAPVAARIEQAALNQALLDANEQIRAGNIAQAQATLDTQWQRSSSANASLGSAKLESQLKVFEEVQADLAAPAAAAEPERKARAKKNAEINRSLMH